jgi:hypothetical protein
MEVKGFFVFEREVFFLDDGQNFFLAAVHLRDNYFSASRSHIKSGPFFMAVERGLIVRKLAT